MPKAQVKPPQPGEIGWTSRAQDAETTLSLVINRLGVWRSDDAEALGEVADVLWLARTHLRLASLDAEAAKQLTRDKTKRIKKLLKAHKALKAKYDEVMTTQINRSIEKMHEANERAEDLAFRLSKYEEV